jgi:hypothetical protein
MGSSQTSVYRNEKKVHNANVATTITSGHKKSPSLIHKNRMANAIKVNKR